MTNQCPTCGRLDVEPYICRCGQCVCTRCAVNSMPPLCTECAWVTLRESINSYLPSYYPSLREVETEVIHFIEDRYSIYEIYEDGITNMALIIHYLGRGDRHGKKYDPDPEPEQMNHPKGKIIWMTMNNNKQIS